MIGMLQQTLGPLLPPMPFPSQQPLLNHIPRQQLTMISYPRRRPNVDISTEPNTDVEKVTGVSSEVPVNKKTAYEFVLDNMCHAKVEIQMHWEQDKVIRSAVEHRNRLARRSVP